VVIDREIGDLKDDLLGGIALLTYLRYNVDLEEEPLRQLGLEDLASRAPELREMSKAENREALNRIGYVAAETLVQADHLPRAFDLKRASS
jgi:hypothetical protein